jgi:pimeloyl-[acyl-carrier protein] methyl ester esterase
LPHLVLLPGLDGTGLLFRPLLAALTTELQPKVIGYPANEVLELPDLAAFVLRQLPPHKVVLLAESFSGLVALSLLTSAPHRIRGVVFVGAFAEPPRPLPLRLAPLLPRSAGIMRSVPSFLLRKYCLGNDAAADDLKLLREAIAGVSAEVLAQRLALVGRRHSFGKAPFEVPSCYIRPSQDRLVPASSVNWFRQRFKSCDVEEIDGPHFVLQARPQKSAEAIERFLRRRS